MNTLKSLISIVNRIVAPHPQSEHPSKRLTRTCSCLLLGMTILLSQTAFGSTHFSFETEELTADEGGLAILHANVDNTPDGFSLSYQWAIDTDLTDSAYHNTLMSATSTTGSFLRFTTLLIDSGVASINLYIKLTATATKMGELTQTVTGIRGVARVLNLNPMPTAKGTIPPQTLSLGRVSTLDVSNFFTYDTLTYSVSSSNMAIATATTTISNSGLLTLSPVATGTTTITVTAAASDNPTLRFANQTFMVTVTVPAFDLNVDGSEQTDVSDGLMIIRYIAGTRGGGDLTAGLSVAPPDDVVAKIKRGIDSGLLNVDVSDQTDVSDGLMIIRYIAGTRGGGDLTAGLSVVPPDDVAANIAGLIRLIP